MPDVAEIPDIANTRLHWQPACEENGLVAHSSVPVPLHAQQVLPCHSRHAPVILEVRGENPPPASWGEWNKSCGSAGAICTLCGALGHTFLQS